MRAFPAAPPISAEADGRGVTVAVVDSGFDHALQEPRVLRGVGIVGEDGYRVELSTDDSDRNGHGTMCSDLILQVAPKASILPIRIFGQVLDSSPAALLAGMRVAMERGVDIISLSLGSERDDLAVPLFALCETARQRCITVVAASSGGSNDYPASFAPVIGVRSAPLKDRFGLHFDTDASAELIACGVNQSARSIGGVTEAVSGSSFAAAVVSGFVARIKAAHPTASLDSVRFRLQALASGVGPSRSSAGW